MAEKAKDKMRGRGAADSASQSGASAWNPGETLLPIARAALIWERVWPRLWPALAIALAFLSLAFFDLLPALPGWLHLLVLVGSGCGFIAALVLGLRGLVLPTRREGLRRLEQDSGLRNRPLSSWDEQLFDSADPASRSLWAAHRRRLKEQVKRLRLKAPRTGLERVDPIALRAALGLILLVAVVGAGPGWRENLARAVTPNLSGPPAPVAKLDLWITPPAYTGLPPAVLATASAPRTPDESEDGDSAGPEARVLPVGSEILVQIQGGRGEPSVTIDGEPLGSFEAVAGAAQRNVSKLETGGLLEVFQGGDSLGAWRLDALPDTPPSIEFAQAPSRSERGALRMDYIAGDDYGITRVGARVTLVERPEETPVELELLLPAGGLESVEQSAFHDFTPHPWAGLPVDIVLTAEDAAGQVSESDPVQTVLPERIFQHPVARALADLRKQLTRDPTRRFPVARALAELYERPQHFFGDVVVALAIHSSQRRLLFNKDLESVRQVQDTLWKTALRIEDGEITLSQRDLMSLMEQLQRALAEGAPDEVIEELMNQLQAAMDRYLDELTRQAMQNMQNNPNQEMQNLPQQNMQSLNRQDLQELLDAARDMSEAGSRETAQELLSQLRNMLENLQTAQSQAGEGQQRGMEMMDELNSMLQRQRELMDRSFRRSQEGQQGGEPGQQQGQQNGQQGGQQGGQPSPHGSNMGDAEAQARLRQELNRMMEELGQMMPGEAPPSLGEAQREMGNAESQLRGNNPGGANQSQRQALSELQQGAQSLVERFMEQMGEGQGGQAGAFGEEAGTTRDPLGRNPAGRGMGEMGGVEVPGISDRQRAQELRRELQRRSGERERPQLERDYLERLLSPF